MKGVIFAADPRVTILLFLRLRIFKKRYMKAAMMQNATTPPTTPPTRVAVLSEVPPSSLSLELPLVSVPSIAAVCPPEGRLHAVRLVELEVMIPELTANSPLASLPLTMKRVPMAQGFVKWKPKLSSPTDWLEVGKPLMTVNARLKGACTEKSNMVQDDEVE